MSEPKDAGPPLDAVTRALADEDLLLPETVAEVARAEAEIDEAEVELPERLRSFAVEQESPARGARAEVTPLFAVPRTKASRAPAFFAGAVTGLLAAAAALFVILRLEDSGTAPIGGTPDDQVTHDPRPSGPVPLQLSEECVGCCAGSACGAASAELRACPSGRACVACAADDQRSAYRIRLSAISVSPEGAAWLSKEAHSLEGAKLCASAGERSLGCRAALEEPGDLIEWSSLPTATTSAQLVGGVVVSLVDTKGTILGRWTNSVHVSPDTLCRGVSLRLTGSDSELVLGKVSAFFDDSYFVELGRRGSVSELTELSKQFSWQGGAPAIYETKQAGQGRFVLTLGPYSLARAEKLRWAVLDAKRDATLTTGADHVGSARPATPER
ncbi:MAG TPA: hypothetical protein VLC09_18840 [Polyangiaceae bacterium]|nr:hypothetical protein [Polyangiaceae bacterium]